MERKGTANDVGYARSTYEKSKRFQRGLEELQQMMPLADARMYLSTGYKEPSLPGFAYALADELQHLRKSGLQAEMGHVKAQVYCLFRDGLANEGFLVDHSMGSVAERKLGAEEAKLELERALKVDSASNFGSPAECARLLLSDAVLEGDDLRFGFSKDIYYAAPSLGVYELFMWTTVEELEGLISPAQDDQQPAVAP